MSDEAAGVIPNVPTEGGLVPATELDFDQRQEWLAGLNLDGTLDVTLKALPDEVRLKWIKDELIHFEERVQDQPAEGGEFDETKPPDEVTVPGSEEPQDRAPDVGKELVAALVTEKFNWEQRALRAESLVNRYREKFGLL